MSSRLSAPHHRVCFQGFHQIPGLDALENVELPAAVPGYGPGRTPPPGCGQPGAGGSRNRLHHRPGNVRRSAAARGHRPRHRSKPPIILADEPTGNLDSRSGREVMALLHALHREGHTVILITHGPAIASEANRRICIHDGKSSLKRRRGGLEGHRSGAELDGKASPGLSDFRASGRLLPKALAICGKKRVC